ncbi:ubiquitin protein ligase, putative [Ichthyophthirius multifiliis]|uniref:HECT-type E3 ubiquitin transferase n=1 Tax=Ichthyophthirius multifiliis TaxID=5932 RepID=G0QMT3_ICHMU|nr:ubiquitin protein ligase, putative [Ichthyophthirius multifiliis]EGR33486.1 ubiquitin protein ligase, putative [Ichthyophthirius multifiliis]|eukprot:XP_004037472.1 ubiquitin protein ligase, putative [Ichthyophthirius multifiliis]
MLSSFHFQRINNDNYFLSKLLNNMPHIFSFEKRYNKLQEFILEDQKGQDRDPFDFYQDVDNEDENNVVFVNSKVVKIRRGKEMEDAFQKFKHKNMKALYKISFLDEHGLQEAGIDGGGIIKEFINSVISQGFNIEYELFIETSQRTLMPAPNNKHRLQKYYFLGSIVGKAIYENILIQPVFSKVFLNQILEKPSTIEDLQYIDNSLYKNLMKLKHTQDDVSQYGLTFSIDDEYNGKVELKQDGSNIIVNNENKYEYISLYAQYKLNLMNQIEAENFRQGFASVIDQNWLSMFSHDELQLIISGQFTAFDVEDLKQNTKYQGYNQYDLIIIFFWECLNEFSELEKEKFLHFVTSCSRPPTLGFKQLNPPFCICKSIDDWNPQHPEKLPSSSTCMNILKLPDYQDKSTLKIKLFEAIFSNSGFDLS